MKRFLTLCVTCFLVIGIAVPGEAAGKPAPKKPVSQNVKIRQKLVPNPLMVDLVSAKGTLDYQMMKKQMQLKVLTRLPIPAPSAGIVDLATAQAADIRLELSREGVVTNTCKLAFLADADEPVPTVASYRLHAKNQGKKFVKGTCLNGLPKMLKGDVASVFALVQGVRVDILTPKP